LARIFVPRGARATLLGFAMRFYSLFRPSEFRQSRGSWQEAMRCRWFSACGVLLSPEQLPAFRTRSVAVGDRISCGLAAP
jgi:hypothetical protein